MLSLDDLAAQRPAWTLDELVDVANELLPTFLPSDGASARVKDEVNGRLVRHYTSEGLLHEPLREGRGVRYEYRHLLEVLVVRRLMAEGLTASAIGDLVQKKSDPELQGLLRRGVRIEISPLMEQTNEALDFLESVRERSSQGRRQATPNAQLGLAHTPEDRMVSQAPSGAPGQSEWTRYQLLDGVELQVRSDVQIPKSLREQETLLQYLMEKLIGIAQRRQR